MISSLLNIDITNNRQLELIVYGIAAVVIVGLIIAYIVQKSSDKIKERQGENIEKDWRARQVLRRTRRKERRAARREESHHIKRETRDPVKKAENEAASRNTLLGGKGEAQREEKEAGEVFGSLGISAKKAAQIDKEKEQLIINGYLQKSNTAPIRPVYSNTFEARQQQKKELDSDEVGKEAETPALVMDSSAPSEVRITGTPQVKVKPTALKRPTSTRVIQSDDADDKQD